jgi:hypothetical protein
MPTTRNRGAVVAVATLGLLLNGALASCSLNKDDDSNKRDTSSAPKPTPTPTSTEQETETPSATPTPSASPSASSATQPVGALLGAAELPPLSSSSPWTELKTTVPGPANFGLCQQFDILSIGAMSVIERSFKGGSAGDTAGQQVAEFPDAQNTVRGARVLEAWQRNCKRDVLNAVSSIKNAKVGAITDVAVPKGKGWYYIVSYTRGGTGHFHELGVTYNRNRMVLLKIDHVGQDHNYPAGQDPMELAVKAASAKM